MQNLLVTGGCGYIGSHTALLLLEKGYTVYIIDSNCNSNPFVINKLKKIIMKKDKQLAKNLIFFKGDLRKKKDIERIFEYSKHNNKIIEAVVHLAGLKSVNESMKYPLMYWDSNLIGTINLLKVMQKYLCYNLIFSSSATIYACPKNKLIDENFPIKPINPYGNTKRCIETLLEDIYNSEKGKWKIISLRYFNPIGAHHSGDIGEDPNGIPNNLFPLILQVASSKLRELKIFGNNWDTRDGTCIRDYIHILDLANAHIAAFEYISKTKSQIINFNIGTGKGTSVLELINTFKNVNKIKLPYSFTSRREGDQKYIVADNSRALSTLNWKPLKSLEDMCRDGWKWQIKNPNGYLDN